MTRKNDNRRFAAAVFWGIISGLVLLEVAFFTGLYRWIKYIFANHPVGVGYVLAIVVGVMMAEACYDTWIRHPYRRKPMADVKVVLEKHLATMASGRECFNYGVTPVIRPQVGNLPAELRQAWWDGLLAGLVEAMVITIGEKATIEVCQDLYTRSKDAKADVDRALEKMRRGH